MRSISRTTLAAVALSAVLLGGCRKEVEKEKMDAVAAWSTAMCACTDGACAKAQLDKQPRLEIMDGDRLIYTKESSDAYGDIENMGMRCYQKIVTAP